MDYRADNWTKKPVDRGFYHLPSGHTDYTDGSKPEPIMDPFTGQQVTEPAFLDGHGQQIAPGANAVPYPSGGYTIDDSAAYSGLFTGLTDGITAYTTPTP